MTIKPTTPNKILFSVSALAALILATGTVAALIAQPAVAQNTSIPTTTHQAQTCDTAGSASSISISCNGTFNNNVANSPNRPLNAPNPPPVELECPAGYTLSQGLCTAQPICPSGATLNTLGQCETTTSIPATCSQGTLNTQTGQCETTANACQSPAVFQPGQCVTTTSTPATCATGTLNPETGQCETTTAVGLGTCSPPSVPFLNERGQFVCADPTPVGIQCPPGTTLAGTRGDLQICQSTSQPTPICTTGQLLPSDNLCITTTTTNACISPATYQTGQCVTSTSTPAICPAGTSGPNDQGQCTATTNACISPATYQTGQCVISTSTPATCPGGITPTNGQCITRPGP